METQFKLEKFNILLDTRRSSFWYLIILQFNKKLKQFKEIFKRPNNYQKMLDNKSNHYGKRMVNTFQRRNLLWIEKGKKKIFNKCSKTWF